MAKNKHEEKARIAVRKQLLTLSELIEIQSPSPVERDEARRWIDLVMNPQPTSPTWIHVLSFALVMESKLEANRHKGNREGWIRCDVRDLIKAMRDELEELDVAIASGNALEISKEGADVANFAMMIADWFTDRSQLPLKKGGGK